MRWTLTHDVMHDAQKQAAIRERLTSLRAKHAAAAGDQPFQFPTRKVGTTHDGRVTLYYDPSLGHEGRQVADAISGAFGCN